MNRRAHMVYCQSCNVVVWAYDHLSERMSDVRGICNMFELPCPLCGSKGNFDGFTLDEAGLETPGIAAYDYWFAMRGIAEQCGLKWNPSLDNTWKGWDRNGNQKL